MSTTSPGSPVTTLQQLLDAPPLVHRVGETALTHALVPAALEFIERTVKPGDRTLETGSGLSTILLAMRGAEHICITPDADEHQRIREYCDQHGIDHSRVTFHAEPSERILPRLELPPLDLVLVDGLHAFPQAFIDWYYTQDALKVGGTLIVDDVHLWTGWVLRDFLKAEPEWDLVDQWWGRTAAFRKTAEVDVNRDWPQQPYVARKTGPDAVRQAKMAAGMLRKGEFGEVATRLRAFARRETVDPHQDRRS